MSWLHALGSGFSVPVIPPKLTSHPPGMPKVTVGRSVKDIKQSLSQKKIDLEVCQKNPRGIKGSITKQKKKIKAQEAIANSRDAMARSARFYLEKEHRPELKRLEAELAANPEKVEEIEEEIIELREELKEAEARETEQAKNKQAKDRELAQQLNKATKKPPTTTLSRQQTSTVSTESHVNKYPKHGKIRKTTVANTKVKEGSQRPMKNHPIGANSKTTSSKSTAARKTATTSSACAPSRSTLEGDGNVAGGTPTAPPMIAPGNNTAAGTKRKVAERSGSERPAKRNKLSNERAHHQRSESGAATSSPPASSRTGSDRQEEHKAAEDLESEAPDKHDKLSSGKWTTQYPESGVPTASPPPVPRTDVDGRDGDVQVLGGMESPAVPEQPAMPPSCAATPRDTSPSLSAGKSSDYASVGLSSTTTHDTSAAMSKAAASPTPPTEKKKYLPRLTGEARRKAMHDSNQTKGLAVTVTQDKKRKVSTDIGGRAAKQIKQALNGTGEDERRSSTTSSASEGNKTTKRGNLNGLINHKNSCFSGVIIQLLDAAFEGHNIDALLGELDGQLEDFGMTDQECKKFDNQKWNASNDKKQNALRAAIEAAAVAGETDKVSAAKHLRRLLEDLHADIPGAADKHASPYLFQTVMAFGAAEDSSRKEGDLSDRQKMSGDTQQDCFEYYQKVLDALEKDTGVNNSDSLKQLFEIKSKIQVKCSKCKYKSSPHDAVNNYHTINVPKTKRGTRIELEELYKTSKSSDVDGTCPDCKNRSLKAKTIFTKWPENFVVKMDRTSFDKATGEATKVDTLVNLGHDLTSKKGDDYELSAVIRHQGTRIDAGHYTILRKCGEGWGLLDDRECSKKTDTEIDDKPRGGQCAMILFKKVKRSEPQSQ